ncbi:unnamed protein product [Tilletia controversa]|uniref:Hydantoinase/oxoprolinase N-terminal domain-containing protein n=1 Tax=Tilletia controversa TaxID=13291 RepID=A0A8X7SS57_9BASI|nr:hypothetical protein CF328_g8620 [Tilletia controversa]KAE8237679.1 hypothetical protein A4X06_0g9153 [Tilletia controversa]CAD6929245.1 unnamed protein product [Tilletia controversa]CAD6933395.1 unnamed protein product [Tilletia controversa]CAD6954722.1 unnamed protein product [Tilletia controversa]
MVTGREIPRGQKIETSEIDYIRLSTSVATNALLECNGEKHAFVTTKGFRDVVQIGNQNRPRIFDTSIRKPDFFCSGVTEIDECENLIGHTTHLKREKNRIECDDRDKNQKAYSGEDLPSHEVDGSGEEISNGASGPKIVQGISGEAVAVPQGNIRREGEGEFDIWHAFLN